MAVVFAGGVWSGPLPGLGLLIWESESTQYNDMLATESVEYRAHKAIVKMYIQSY